MSTLPSSTDPCEPITEIPSISCTTSLIEYQIQSMIDNMCEAPTLDAITQVDHKDCIWPEAIE